MSATHPEEIIERRIFSIRGHRVMISPDLAELYGVEPKVLTQAVMRNLKRFPHDFMFQLSKEEYETVKPLRSQNVTLKRGSHAKYLPYAFTEQGVAMLSAVLNSDRAIETSIAIMKAFVRLRELMSTHKDLARKLDEMEMKYDHQFKVVFDAIRQLMKPVEKTKSRIGFLQGEKR